MRSERFLFANHLRGIAALCVVAVHLGAVYWTARGLVAAATFSPVQTGAAPAASALVATTWLNLGPFGVALFFLISGFVIPMSLERLRPAAFLVARIWRIYPTYIAALFLEVGIVTLSGRIWHQPFTYGTKLIVVNTLLLTDVFNLPSIDLVNWTLTIELKFYLLMALLARPIRRGSLTTLLALAVGIVAVSRFSHEIFRLVPAAGLALRIFESNALYVLFMLIGVVFSYHARGRIRGRTAIAAVLVLFALFVGCWPLTFFRGDFPQATINYGYALALFGAMYMARRHMRSIALLDFFAAISYPLYLVHALVGWTVMKFLSAHGVNAGFATVLAFGAVVGLATVLHRTIEIRSQAFGKTIAARCNT